MYEKASPPSALVRNSASSTVNAAGRRQRWPKPGKPPGTTNVADRVPLSERPIAELRAQAAEYRRMAATARHLETQGSLLKLADRMDALADQREGQ